MVGRNDADSQIELFFANRDFDAAVLRPTSLGDVNFGKDLDPRDYGRMLTPGQGISLSKYAIDSIPNSNAMLKRFDMNVRSS